MEIIAQNLEAMNSTNPQYENLKQQYQQRKNAIDQITRSIGEMKKKETNEMLKGVMND
jgi:chromosome segregation ATPase